ncbi:MAG: hypothetical protein H7138_23890 [Myxococcales bacterium]|nr:hypothetical protein [Myxococcales bacterium]
MLDAQILVRLRQLLRALLAAGLVGSAVDLLFLDHVEDPLQLVPLAAIGLSLGALGWHAASPRAAAVRGFQIAMVLLTATAVIGIALHGRGSVEFQHDMDPSLSGLNLLVTVLRAKSPPTLAPGNLALLGLVGLASTYRQRATLDRPIPGG